MADLKKVTGAKANKTQTEASNDRVEKLTGLVTKALDAECERVKKYTVFEIIKALCKVMYQYNSIGLRHQHNDYGENEPIKADA